MVGDIFSSFSVPDGGMVVENIYGKLFFFSISLGRYLIWDGKRKFQIEFLILGFLSFFYIKADKKFDWWQ